MFAGERPAQLAAVRHHLDAARQASVTPIAASHYAAIADGFFSTRDHRLGEIRAGSSAIAARCRPCASMMPTDVTVDFARSVGVLGQRKKGTSLYVALDEAQDEVIVALAPRSRRCGGSRRRI